MLRSSASGVRARALADGFSAGWVFLCPSAGFTQEPHTAKNLGYIIPAGVHLPTTMDYAVRVTQAEHPHFSFDIGVGQVAGNIGTAVLPTGLPAPYPPTISLPVNLQARKVVGMGLSYRY